MDERPRFGDESQPADYKTACDGRGGLVRVRITGGPHDGRSLYIDELDLPSVIYSTGQGRRFEWWPERSHAQMSGFPIATDPESATVRYTLRVPDDTREPAFTADATTPD